MQLCYYICHWFLFNSLDQDINIHLESCFFPHDKIQFNIYSCLVLPEGSLSLELLNDLFSSVLHHKLCQRCSRVECVQEAYRYNFVKIGSESEPDMMLRDHQVWRSKGANTHVNNEMKIFLKITWIAVKAARNKCVLSHYC